MSVRPRSQALFTLAQEPPPNYAAPTPGTPEAERRSAGALAVLSRLGLPPAVLAVFDGPAQDGRLGVLVDPPTFDPVVYVAISSGARTASAEAVYVGRTSDLPGRVSRHRRAFAPDGPWPDVWAAIRVPAPLAADAEEGLIRHLQSVGHPAHLLVSRGPYAGGHFVSGGQVRVLRNLGMVP